MIKFYSRYRNGKVYLRCDELKIYACVKNDEQVKRYTEKEITPLLNKCSDNLEKVLVVVDFWDKIYYYYCYNHETPIAVLVSYKEKYKKWFAVFGTDLHSNKNLNILEMDIINYVDKIHKEKRLCKK